MASRRQAEFLPVTSQWCGKNSRLQKRLITRHASRVVWTAQRPDDFESPVVWTWHYFLLAYLGQDTLASAAQVFIFLLSLVSLLPSFFFFEFYSAACSCAIFLITVTLGVVKCAFKMEFAEPLQLREPLDWGSQCFWGRSPYQILCIMSSDGWSCTCLAWNVVTVDFDAAWQIFEYKTNKQGCSSANVFLLSLPSPERWRVHFLERHQRHW